MYANKIAPFFFFWPHSDTFVCIVSITGHLISLHIKKTSAKNMKQNRDQKRITEYFSFLNMKSIVGRKNVNIRAKNRKGNGNSSMSSLFFLAKSVHNTGAQICVRRRNKIKPSLSLLALV